MDVRHRNNTAGRPDPPEEDKRPEKALVPTVRKTNNRNDAEIQSRLAELRAKTTYTKSPDVQTDNSAVSEPTLFPVAMGTKVVEKACAVEDVDNKSKETEAAPPLTKPPSTNPSYVAPGIPTPVIPVVKGVAVENKANDDVKEDTTAEQNIAPPSKNYDRQEQQRHCQSIAPFAKLNEEMAKAMNMNVGDLKRELQARGIDTESFVEKRNLVKAYVEAVIVGTAGEGAAAEADEEPLNKETAKAMSMNVGELKRELQARGISTESFVEKRNLVKAYVEAVVVGTAGEGAAAEADEDH